MLKWQNAHAEVAERTCLGVLGVVQEDGSVRGSNGGEEVVIGWMPASTFQPALGGYQKDRVKTPILPFFITAA